MKWLFKLVALFISAAIAMAQCALCKSVVQSSGDQNLIASLREGILLLLVMPYIILGSIAFAIYRAYKSGSRTVWGLKETDKKLKATLN